MTPKQKAEDLVNILLITSAGDNPESNLRWAKLSALLAINEITQNTNNQEFWKEVKHIIETT